MLSLMNNDIVYDIKHDQMHISSYILVRFQLELP